ncbi:MAG TPA: enoyl-CoA hydratase-related protein [candidate division Zixibacteria bacterium]|nr:enoyl-CoA hydratase-related protein [candidate division Zixibacteria bacterium]
MAALRVERDGPVTRVTLARPEVRNAFNAALIGELHDAFTALAREPAQRMRAVVLAGEGPVFSAGADINWQRAALHLTLEENEADAARLQAMLRAIDECPAPVIARVQGAALGGGMALCAVSDVVLATADARFGFTEVKLGILPAVISPFVLPRIGEGQARALYLSGERFGAERALRIGLVHEVLPDETALDGRVDALLGELLAAGPNAVRQAKLLIRVWRDLPSGKFAAHAVRVAARQRVSAEGQEGLTAFLDKRRASWSVERAPD